MTQPPDEQPTVAWTPPGDPAVEPDPSGPGAPPEPVGGPDPAPDAPAPVKPDAPAPAMPGASPPMPDARPAAPTSPPADDPQNPLISWAPSGAAAAGAAGAAGAPGATPQQPGAVVGWESPSETLPPSAVEGYQTAGVGSRIVAWLFDISIIAILSIVVLVVLVIISPDTFRRDSFATAALSAIMTTGLSFLYFVGQWTGSSGATLGMRSLGLRVVDAPGPRTLGIGPAIVRWAGFGYPLTIVALIPVLGSVVSWALTGWTIVLLISTAMSDTNQGLHDRFAGSAVLRRIGAGSGWAVIGCIGLIALFFIGIILLPIIALATLSPEMQDQFWTEFMRQMQLEMERQS
jgi:uncharacterized RDD family membrane protein YckC